MGKHFSKVIKKARANQGITQQQVAEFLDIHKQFVSNMERGIALVPEKRLFKLATILNVAPQKLINPFIKEKKEALELTVEMAALLERSK